MFDVGCFQSTCDELWKKLLRRLAGRYAEFFQRTAFDLRDDLRNLFHICRLAPLVRARHMAEALE